MIKSKKPRKQCVKCPWKVGTDPREIPNGYSEALHRRLLVTIAKPCDLTAVHVPVSVRKVMSCHESKVGKEVACVGWLANQLGVGNNLELRVAVMRGEVDANVEVVGPQHATFEDTFPRS